MCFIHWIYGETKLMMELITKKKRIISLLLRTCGIVVAIAFARFIESKGEVKEMMSTGQNLILLADFQYYFALSSLFFSYKKEVRSTSLLYILFLFDLCILLLSSDLLTFSIRASTILPFFFWVCCREGKRFLLLQGLPALHTLRPVPKIHSGSRSYRSLGRLFQIWA